MKRAEIGQIRDRLREAAGRELEDRGRHKQSRYARQPGGPTELKIPASSQLRAARLRRKKRAAPPAASAKVEGSGTAEALKSVPPVRGPPAS